MGSRISNRDEGLEQKLRRCSTISRNFKIANPDAQQQMQDMLERLGMLRDRNLGPAEQALTRAGKSLEQNAEPSPGSAASKDEPSKTSPDQPQGEKEQTSSHTAGKESKEEPPSQAGGKEAQKEAKAAGKEAQKGAPAGEPKDRAGVANPPQQNKPAGEQPAQAGPGSQPQNQPPPSPQDIARRSLAEAKTNQKAIADELQKMLEGLGEFETYRGVVKDAQDTAQEARRDHEASGGGGDQARPDGQVGRVALAGAEGRPGNLAARQSEVAKGLQNLLERMDELAKRLDESDPLAAAAMRDAAGNSRKQGTTAKMGEAAEQLEKNQMGQARAAAG